MHEGFFIGEILVLYVDFLSVNATLELTYLILPFHED